MIDVFHSNEKSQSEILFENLRAMFKFLNVQNQTSLQIRTKTLKSLKLNIQRWNHFYLMFKLKGITKSCPAELFQISNVPKPLELDVF